MAAETPMVVETQPFFDPRQVFYREELTPGMVVERVLGGHEGIPEKVDRIEIVAVNQRVVPKQGHIYDSAPAPESYIPDPRFVIWRAVGKEGPPQYVQEGWIGLNLAPYRGDSPEPGTWHTIARYLRWPEDDK
jgi:hypothetical protein